MKEIKLYIDMIPRTSWYTNARSILAGHEWNKIKRKVYQINDNKCSICNGKGPKHPVEAHERWEYNEDTRIQKMVDIIPLCPKCHLTTHYGLAQIQGKEAMAYEHFKAVNGFEEHEVEHYMEEGYKTWIRLSKIDWIVDVTYLIDKYEDDLTEITKERILSEK